MNALRRVVALAPPPRGRLALSACLGAAAVVFGIGLMTTAGYLIASLKKKADAPANPWGGTTLEWLTTSPPPYYNFHTPPDVLQGPYDGYENLVYDEKVRGYVAKKS